MVAAVRTVGMEAPEVAMAAMEAMVAMAEVEEEDSVCVECGDGEGGGGGGDVGDGHAGGGHAGCDGGRRQRPVIDGRGEPLGHVTPRPPASSLLTFSCLSSFSPLSDSVALDGFYISAFFRRVFS